MCINPAVPFIISQRMLPVFATCCIDVINRWEKLMSSKGSSEIDIWPEFQNLTGDVISRTAFGSSYQEGMKIFELQGELAERLVQSFQPVFIPGYWFVLLFLKVLFIGFTPTSFCIRRFYSFLSIF